MRSMWSGSITFGLINVPVKLYSGSEEHALSFDLLHKKDLSPIRYARICKAEEKEVPYKDIVKGYEYEKGEYVVIDTAEFKKAEQEKSNSIEIALFTDQDEIDPIYYDKPYFLEPDKGAEKTYALLRDALRASGKVGVVKYVFRNKGHIGILKPYENALILIQMRYASEIRSLDDLKLPKEKQVNKKELDMALKLVDQLSEKFKPEAFKDEYTKELKKEIDAKIKGKPLKKKGGAAPKPSKIHDIMGLLKESLEKEKPAKSKKHPKLKKAS